MSNPLPPTPYDPVVPPPPPPLPAEIPLPDDGPEEDVLDKGDPDSPPPGPIQ